MTKGALGKSSENSQNNFTVGRSLGDFLFVCSYSHMNRAVEIIGNSSIPIVHLCLCRSGCGYVHLIRTATYSECQHQNLTSIRSQLNICC